MTHIVKTGICVVIPTHHLHITETLSVLLMIIIDCSSIYKASRYTDYSFKVILEDDDF